jgi:hypothetical protein
LITIHVFEKQRALQQGVPIQGGVVVVVVVHEEKLEKFVTFPLTRMDLGLSN